LYKPTRQLTSKPTLGVYLRPAKSCLHLRQSGIDVSGYYFIKPAPNSNVFEVN